MIDGTFCPMRRNGQGRIGRPEATSAFTAEISLSSTGAGDFPTPTTLRTLGRAQHAHQFGFREAAEHVSRKQNHVHLLLPVGPLPPHAMHRDIRFQSAIQQAAFRGAFVIRLHRQGKPICGQGVFEHSVFEQSYRYVGHNGGGVNFSTGGVRT